MNEPGASTLHLDVHGVRVRIDSDTPAALSPLREDFAYFAAGPAPADITLALLRQRPVRPGPRGLLRWRSAAIAHRAGRRFVDYGAAALEYDLKAERGTLFAEDPRLLHELAYLAVLSRTGQRLDQRGRHRVHALGFTYRGGAGLLLLPSGGGKSRLGLELLGREDFRLLSDDTPLLSADGNVFPFPLRLSLRGRDWQGIPERHLSPFERRCHGPKTLVSLEHFRDRLGTQAPLEWLVVGLGPRLARARAAGELARGLVLGVGVPQVLELMFPAPPFLPGAAGLARIAAARAACAFAAVRRARSLGLTIDADPRRSADALEALLSR